MQMLSGKQVRFLRALGHHLHPVVMIGREGLTERVVASTEAALEAHELIKVRVQEGCDLDRRDAARLMAEATGSAVAQVLGRTFLLYRSSEKNIIQLP